MPPHSPGHIAWLATPGASKSPATPRRKLASLGFGPAADAERRQLLDLEDGKLESAVERPQLHVVHRDAGESRSARQHRHRLQAIIVP